MKYRVVKERRLIKPYKIQDWSALGGWHDRLKVKRLSGSHGLVRTLYFWTRRGALKAIQHDPEAKGFFDE